VDAYNTSVSQYVVTVFRESVSEAEAEHPVESAEQQAAVDMSSASTGEQ